MKNLKGAIGSAARAVASAAASAFACRAAHAACRAATCSAVKRAAWPPPPLLRRRPAPPPPPLSALPPSTRGSAPLPISSAAPSSAGVGGYCCEQHSQLLCSISSIPSGVATATVVPRRQRALANLPSSSGVDGYRQFDNASLFHTRHLRAAPSSFRMGKSGCRAPQPL